MYSWTELKITMLLMSAKHFFFLAKDSNTSSSFLFSFFLFIFFLFGPIISIFPQNVFHDWARSPVVTFFYHSVIIPHLLNRYCVIKDGLLQCWSPQGSCKSLLNESKRNSGTIVQDNQWEVIYMRGPWCSRRRNSGSLLFILSPMRPHKRFTFKRLRSQAPSL